MPSPSTSMATLRNDLADSFLEFDLAAGRSGFIASRVLTVLDVAQQASTFPIIPLEQLLEKRDTLRAPGAPYSRSQWTFGKGSYATDDHGAEEPVDDREAAMYDDFFEAEQIASLRAFDAVLRNAEMRAAALIFDTTTWTGSALTTAVANKWDVAASGTPRTDVKNAKIAVWNASGLQANALIVSNITFEHMKDSVEIIDRIKYSGLDDPNPSAIDERAMARALGIEEVIVAGSPKNTANEGQTAVIGTVWDNTMAMVCRVARTNDVREPAIARTFHWSADGSTPGGTVESYRDESVRSLVIRVRHDVDEVLLRKEAGHLLTGVM